MGVGQTAADAGEREIIVLKAAHYQSDILDGRSHLYRRNSSFLPITSTAVQALTNRALYSNISEIDFSSKNKL